MKRAYRADRLSTPKRHWSRWLLIAGGVLIACAAAVTALELTNTTHFFHKNAKDARIIVKAGKPTASTPTEQPPPTNPEKTPTPTNDGNQGTAIDTHGSQTSTDPKQWVTSKSGDITVKQPSANATIKPGAVVAGSAKVNQVQYRLIDDQTGVIAQGPLSVVNGNFSGSLQFQAHSSGGRLDVFSFDPSGAEINEVQIIISF